MIVIVCCLLGEVIVGRLHVCHPQCSALLPRLCRYASRCRLPHRVHLRQVRLGAGRVEAALGGVRVLAQGGTAVGTGVNSYKGEW